MYEIDKCPYCIKAKLFIRDTLNSTVHVRNVTEDLHTRELIAADTGHKTFPAIFLGEEFIGGCDDLIRRIHEGTLQIPLLKEEIRLLKNEINKLRRGI
tara:strand:- start:18516 stop:18809 length:294 start_codon:yes stop_codon:yes gene_type:complete